MFCLCLELGPYLKLQLTVQSRVLYARININMKSKQCENKDNLVLLKIFKSHQFHLDGSPCHRTQK
jgi:hypothetical protein